MGPDTELPVTSRLRWESSTRLVSSRYPPVQVFEDTVWPEDLEVVLAVLAITDPSARAAAGDVSLVAPRHRVSGPGSSPLMAAFTHPSPSGSRFADATLGVYYAARTLSTAIEETSFHQSRALAEARTRTTDVELNVYIARIDALVHDVRGSERRFPECFVTDPAEYARSQALARRLRATGSAGLVYDSVRHAGGQCVAMFSPAGVRLPVEHGGTVLYHWDGETQRIVGQTKRLR